MIAYNINTAALEDLAIELAAQAAELICLHRPVELASSTKSSVTDPVTAMDRRSETLIRRHLAVRRPGDGVYGEEEGGLPGSIGSGVITWVVDPIDGTVNYLYDLGHYAVSVAAVEGDPRVPGQWTPLAGAVADPSHARIYHARRGGGAWVRELHLGAPEGAVAPPKSATKLAISGAQALGTSLIATGFSYQPQVRREQASALVEVLPRVRDIRRFGSAALDLCAVAAGHVDGYYEQCLNPWDYAAGWLLVTEAGGRVSGWASDPVGGHRLVAGSECVRRDLVYLLDGLVGSS
ncbi:MAG: inositol monophosphatase [Austwickia sp.]|jgi:myo-inositol-1(or 4)-monophosphatase|nr:inositol monophosphatase [Austwickia sp.]MBK8435545.1 inositol monophosphatase [Austwickia sp.]MBK9100883.1 inositol monophosphatase [Austwickia sp.]